MTCCQYKHSAELEQSVALVQSARSARRSIVALVWSARSVRRSIKGEVYMLFICVNVSTCRDAETAGCRRICEIEHFNLCKTICANSIAGGRPTDKLRRALHFWMRTTKDDRNAAVTAARDEYVDGAW